MMRYGTGVLRFVLLLSARVVLAVALLASLAAAWAYYGYKNIGCHPMFSSSNIECGSVPVLAAEHSLAMVRTVLPFQQDILENQTQLISYASAALGVAILIELVFALIAIVQRRSMRKKLPYF
jgi:hypothetical protein